MSKVPNIIYVYQQTDDQDGEGGPHHSSSLLDVINLKKKNANSGQYLLDIIRELQDIESKWAKLLKNSDDQIQRAKKQKIDVEDDVAFARCVALLDEEYENEEGKFSKMRRKMKVAIQSAQEHIQVCQTQQKQRAQEIQKLKVEIQELQSQGTNFGKKVKRKYQIRQKIEEYKKEIEAYAVRLQAAKQKSYEQRNLYLETQQVQLKFEGSLSKIDGDEKIYYQFKNREEKYRQLSKMIQKLHSKGQGGNHDVQSYLKEKIGAVAHLRSSILNLQQKHQQYDNSIEEQVFVIEGLHRRATQERENEDDAFKIYQNKYEKMYFSKSNDINNWKNYKSYLQEVLKRDRIEPNQRQQSRIRYPRETFTHKEPQAAFKLQRQHSSLAKTPLTNSNFIRKYSNLRTQPHLTSIQEQEEDSRVIVNFKQTRSFINENSPIHRFKRDLPNQIPYDSVRLPKLGRSNMKSSLQSGKIKGNIKRMMDQSNVSFESVISEDAMSGQFLQFQGQKK